MFVAIVLFFWGIGEGMFFNFVPIYLETQFFLSEQMIGVMLGAFGFFMMITHIPSGHLADRVGRLPLLIAASAMGFLATLIMWLTTTLSIYLAGIFLYGLTAFISSPLSSYVTAGRGKWSVSTALALNSAMFNLGMVLGPLASGWIGDRYGMRTTYLTATIAFVISTIFVMLLQSQPIDKHDPAFPPVSIWKNKGLVSFLSVAGFAVFAMYLAQPLTPNFLNGVRHLSLTDTGRIFSVGALGNMLLVLAISRAKPNHGFIIAQIFVIFFALCVWQSTGLPILMLGYFLLGGFRGARPSILSQARELVHESQMGLTYGAIETVNSFIFIFTPPLAGFLYELDPYSVYPIAIGLIIISIIVSLIYFKRKVSHA